MPSMNAVCDFSPCQGLSFEKLKAAIAIACGLAARLLARCKTVPAKPPPRRDEEFLLQFTFLLGALLCPIVVLTVDTPNLR